MKFTKRRKKKYGFVKKYKIKHLLIAVFFQLLILSCFINLLLNSKKIELNETISTDIVVGETNLIQRGHLESSFVVFSDGNTFYFPNQTGQLQLSNSKLYDVISEGSQLSIIYFEKTGLFGTKNWVVDARSEKIVYRSIEEYNKNKIGVIPLLVVLFLVIEIIYCGVLLFDFYFETQR